ncbi:uncharacterized protein [Nicotiana sylvestris]|uniref:uncharacterized protein n=1 Tax=Nicotiana sylvestris TaxID=4096 RepID=UPI00388CB410
MLRMLRKDIETSWTEDCQKAFERIKEYLSTPPVLVPPEPGRPLLLYLYVLDGAYGCVLGQHDKIERKEQAIYYLSKKFTPYEARYSLLERTCYTLTWTTQKLRHYFCDYTTYLISRMDPLKYIFQKPMPTGKLAKWQILLSEFDNIYVTQKAVKGQALADHLTENPFGGEYKPLKMYFPDEEVSFVGEDITEAYDGWKMFFDGAANFKGVGIGAVLVSEIGQHYPVSAKIRCLCTNNMAEYEACIMGLYLANDMNIQELLVIGDSDLLLYRSIMSRAFNKRFKPRQFAPGQLVLKKIFPHQDEAKGKLSPNRKGPYMVHRVLTGVAIILAEIDGEVWPKLINSDAVKRYYV